MGRLKDALEEIAKQPMQEQQLLQKGLGTEGQQPARESLSFLGDKDGVSVQVENSAYIVTTPNNYDIFWELGRRNRDTQQPYAERIQSEDRTKAVFAFPIPSTDSALKDFEAKIRTARATSAEVTKEREQLEFVVGFDHANGKQPAFVYKNPTTGFTTGEVLKAGKFFVAMTAGENNDKKYFRVINTSRLLEGKEFTDRESAIKEKMPVGSKKYIKFAENGRLTVQDYTAKIAPVAKPLEVVKPVEVAPVEPGQLTRPQREAVMAFRESHLKDWKRSLSTAWSTGNYKGTDSNQAALLQQVRNEQGPEWLVKVTSKELYGITDEPVKAAKVKTMQMEM